MTEYTILTPSDIYEIESRCDKESANKIKRIFRDEEKGILSAYDTYKTEVTLKSIVREVTDTSEISTVLAWKQDLLDLKTEAFANIPQEVAYYYTKYKK